MQRHFLRKIAHNEDYVVNFCNDINNLFQKIGLECFDYNKPGSNMMERFKIVIYFLKFYYN